MDRRAAPLYEFGDFRLDAGRRLLLDRDGTPVPLTPKAFDTLRYLVEHVGGVVEKEALMRAIWPDTAVEENNLNQNILLHVCKDRYVPPYHIAILVLNECEVYSGDSIPEIPGHASAPSRRGSCGAPRGNSPAE